MAEAVSPMISASLAIARIPATALMKASVRLPGVPAKSSVERELVGRDQSVLYQEPGSLLSQGVSAVSVDPHLGCTCVVERLNSEGRDGNVAGL